MLSLPTLAPGDEAALEAFLARHADASMILRSNLRAAGLVDRGQPLQGTYVAAERDGRIEAVAGHFWNGMVILQAPTHLAETVRAAATRSGRRVRGLMGPLAQVEAARTALDLDAVPAAKAGREILFTLDLAELRVPEALRAGTVICRPPRDEELEPLTAWRSDFGAEALGFERSPEWLATAREEIALLHRLQSHWVLVEDGRLVAYSAFNARLPDMVQVGGVWTPPELRNRGYGRVVVAGTLLEAWAAGVRRAILFTPEDNVGAQRAYEALGFRRAGEYGLVLFGEE